jgi:hypothetical protein
MMEAVGVQRIKLPQIVPPEDLAEWRRNIRKVGFGECPPEVVDFIEVLADKLDDFIRIRTEQVMVSGEDLLLGNVKEVRGEPVYAGINYPTPLPYMVAADHRAAMYRIFHRKGKQGLIDFCKAKVHGTELERILQVLNIIIFKEERPEFRKMMDEIEAAPKIESNNV